MFLREQASVPDITDCDSEKAFIFKQAKMKGIAEVFHKPQELMEHIQRGINKA